MSDYWIPRKTIEAFIISYYKLQLSTLRNKLHSFIVINVAQNINLPVVKRV